MYVSLCKAAANLICLTDLSPLVWECRFIEVAAISSRICKITLLMFCDTPADMHSVRATANMIKFMRDEKATKFTAPHLTARAATAPRATRKSLQNECFYHNFVCSIIRSEMHIAQVYRNRFNSTTEWINDSLKAKNAFCFWEWATQTKDRNRRKSAEDETSEWN